MALENLTGDKYIDSLVATNPTSADFKQYGPNHIFGIKNVLKKTFPNVTGAITLTHTQINQAAFASGTKMVFAQAAAPTGWTGDATAYDHMLRLVASGGSGGSSGGTISPISGGLTATANHVLTTAEIPAHTHNYNRAANLGALFAVNSGSGQFFYVNEFIASGVAGSGAGHAHDISWTPKYFNLIIATKI